MLDAVHVSARLLVSVVAADQRLAGDDAVLVVELDAVAVGGEERRSAREFVVLNERDEFMKLLLHL